MSHPDLSFGFCRVNEAVLTKKNYFMNNSFVIGDRYNASQKISKFALSNGHAPLFYQDLIYKGFDHDTKEHAFDYNGDTKWFDDDFINNRNSEDNSMTFAPKVN